MATPKPGEIRCPTCHRSTPPAAFCTQCGSAIPSDARIRPRGMDRDELQERIRARRSGGDPYRRGAVADEAPGYEQYQPEPEDDAARARRRAAEPRRDLFDESAAVPAARGDLTRDTDDDWAPAAAPVPSPGVEEPQQPVDPDARYDNFDDASYADEPYDPGYEYDEWERDRRDGGSPWAIVGFLALGVLALLGGALLANVFSDDGGVGQVPSPTPTVAATVEPTPSPTATVEATDGGTTEPTADASQPADEPVEFPDGFVVEAQPCLPGSADVDGCDSNAATNSGSLWAWVGFRNGTEDDVVGAELIGPDGNSLTSGSIDLADIGCRPTCPGGWTYFPYSNLSPGEYEVRITRNGEPAGTMHFEVG